MFCFVQFALENFVRLVRSIEFIDLSLKYFTFMPENSEVSSL